MTEALIQSEFSKKNTKVGCFELKLCKGKSIRFDSVKIHQLAALIAASTEKGLKHKINDAPIYAGMKTRFTNKKPFDFIFLKYIPSYIVICFYVPRKKKRCYYVKPQDWVLATIGTQGKSIREEAIAKISSYVLDL